MKKLLISQEQEESLERFKESVDSDFYLQGFINQRKSTYVTTAFYKINDFTPEQFALLLCGWYEVVEPFEVGNWVVHKESGTVGEIIINVIGTWDVKTTGDGFSFIPYKFRKATTDEIAQEQERRKWDAIGREIDVYHVGDIFSFEEDFHRVSVWHPDCVTDETGERFLRNEIELVCPVEQRFDKEEAK